MLNLLSLLFFSFLRRQALAQMDLPGNRDADIKSEELPTRGPYISSWLQESRSFVYSSSPPLPPPPPPFNSSVSAVPLSFPRPVQANNYIATNPLITNSSSVISPIVFRSVRCKSESTEPSSIPELSSPEQFVSGAKIRRTEHDNDSPPWQGEPLNEEQVGS